MVLARWNSPLRNRFVTATTALLVAAIAGYSQVSTGTITGSGGNFTVSGTHTYNKTGTFTVKVTITDVDNTPNSATATTTATVTATTTAKPKHKTHVVHGSARVTGTPSACVLNAFTMQVKGKQISSVAWSLDGRRIGGKTVHRGKQYSARISVSPGTHRVTVKISFRKSSHTRARTAHKTVSGCPIVAPKFTG